MFDAPGLKECPRAAEETDEGIFVLISTSVTSRAPGDGSTARPGAREDPQARQAIGPKPQSPEQVREIERLRARDTEVRAHEAAHAAAAGALGGRPSLDYVVGPDGKRYAVAGEVSIDTSPGRTPEETIAKARTIRAAATAPANPSAQDMAVASDAARMEADARSAIRARQQIEHRARSEKVDQVDEQAPSPERVSDAVAAAETSDADAVLMQLAREQLAARGGSGHSHLAVDCGFCRRATSAYA